MLSLMTDDGVALAWSQAGPADAPALLLCNSIGSTQRMWRPQVEALKGRFRVIGFDARGHGQSGVPAGEYSLERLALDAVAVLDAAEVETAHVCGLSLGGLVAQRMALDHGDRIGRLILANTGSRIGTAESWNARIALVREQGMEELAELAIGRFFDAAFIAAHPEIVAPIREDLLACSPVGYAGACAALRDADLTPAIAAISNPTLVIGGALDVSTPPSSTQAIAAAIPGARHVVLDAAHLSNLEQPAAFTAALEDFLESPHG